MTESVEEIQVNQDDPKFIRNNYFRTASEGIKIPPAVVKLGIETTNRAYWVGALVGVVVILCFLLGFFLFESNPVYFYTFVVGAVLMILSGVAQLFKWFSISTFLLTLNPFATIVVMSIGYNDNQGFFISALSIFIFISAVFLPRPAHYINLVLTITFILFQYLGGPVWLLGEPRFEQSTTEKLILSLVWLFAFIASIRVNDLTVIRDMRRMFELNAELDETKRSLTEANQALDRSNASLEERVKERTMALESTLARANAANVAKDRFLATMSHELRTPLNAIIGYSEYIPEILEDMTASHIDEAGYEIHNVAEKIGYAGNNLLILINDVLNVSQLETGKVTLHIGTLKFDAFAKNLVTLITPQAVLGLIYQPEYRSGLQDRGISLGNLRRLHSFQRSD